jgi:alpha-mannosidase
MLQAKDFNTDQLEGTLHKLYDSIYRVVESLDITVWSTNEPLSFEKRQQGNKKEIKPGEKWGELFDCAWFHFRGRVPKSAAGEKVVLLLDVNGELCVYDQKGTPLRGLTTTSSFFDFRLGRPGKRVFPFLKKATGGERVDLWADAGNNDLFGNFMKNGTVQQADIAICHEPVRQLSYDFEVLFDLWKVLPSESVRSAQVFRALFEVTQVLEGDLTAGVKKAQKILAPLLAQKEGDTGLQISAIGHAHLDLAWMWPIRETIRKGARTFSTAIELMQRYPDYRFGATQPQLYQWMKEHYPGLYRKIKQKVKAGKIEPQGAMWVESDTNLTSGESLIRQILYGKRFFKEEFGVDVDYISLPDVFGYSGALPQILAKSNIDYFMTQKLSWSLINDFPYHSFHWKGIDGSSVLAHMLPEETYNSSAAPRAVEKIARNYRDRDVSGHTLMLFGIGDGGGGPGAEHLERLKREKNLQGLSPVVQESMTAFFEKWSRDAEKFQTWIGELYLERHQGTFTTNAESKRYNRLMEKMLREVEWSSSLATLFDKGPYPKKKLEAIWKRVLLYQFHDILPGSSIKRVYDESLADYAEMKKELHQMDQQNKNAIAGLVESKDFRYPLVVFNSLSWNRNEWMHYGDNWYRVEVPAMGYRTIEAEITATVEEKLTARERLLENGRLRVRFSAKGSLTSIYDKSLRREVLARGEEGNRFVVYRDKGDAWDFRVDYTGLKPESLRLLKSTAAVEGPCAVIKQEYAFGYSRLYQDIILKAGSDIIEFDTRVDWRTPETMLRVQFPVAVFALESTSEIQFGSIKRPTHTNTSWDMARDEIPAMKWVDLSQRDYGVALLNDSKYGHRIKGHTIDLNLLRSVPYTGTRVVSDEMVKPGEPHHAFTDQGEHRFRYALMPHAGDHIRGRVVQRAFEFNTPLTVTETTAHKGPLPAAISFVNVEDERVVVETVKQAENEKALVLRFYESSYAGVETRVHITFPVSSAYEVNLLEEEQKPLRIHDHGFILTLQPFEIKTVKLI